MKQLKIAVTLMALGAIVFGLWQWHLAAVRSFQRELRAALTHPWRVVSIAHGELVTDGPIKDIDYSGEADFRSVTVVVEMVGHPEYRGKIGVTTPWPVEAFWSLRLGQIFRFVHSDRPSRLKATNQYPPNKFRTSDSVFWHLWPRTGD